MNTTAKLLVTKPGGRDAGLLKGQANRSKGMTTISSQTTSGKTASQKSAVEKFNDYRLTKSARLEDRRKRKHDLKMAQASNKRLKYEFKLKNAEGERHNADVERQARLKELELQIQLAQLANPIARVARAPSSVYSNPVSTPIQPRPPLSPYNNQTPLSLSAITATPSDFSSAKSSVASFDVQASFLPPSFGSFGGGTAGTLALEGSSGDEWMKSGNNVFANENFDDIYCSQ